MTSHGPELLPANSSVHDLPNLQSLGLSTTILMTYSSFFGATSWLYDPVTPSIWTFSPEGSMLLLRFLANWLLKFFRPAAMAREEAAYSSGSVNSFLSPISSSS